jgi:hypothetical protein
MRTLDNCRWAPRWVSHLGCIKGCLDYLGIDVSDAWLFGGTGHAFVLNLHEGVCPSGPTAWHTMRLFELGRNLGYHVDGVFGSKQNLGFRELQQQAWDHARRAIDRGLPCYGWELEIPEFYVVYGYDDVGYHFSGPGCDEGKGPKPWQELGDTGIGVLELYSVAPGQTADDATTVKEALSFALAHAANAKEWVFEHYRAGLDGYDNWIRALQEGKASDMGMRYNAGVWLECRKYAAGFLQEAKSRLADRAGAEFDDAQAHYAAVSEALAKVAELYPWTFESSDEDLLAVDDASCTAVKALQAAKEAEAAGLQALARIVKAL